jgi:hypothetical protein
MGAGTLSPVGKLHDLEGDHSNPTNAGVKNQRSYISVAPVYFHGVDKNFTFLMEQILRMYHFGDF